MPQPTVLAHADAASHWLAGRVAPGGMGTLRTDSRHVRPGDAFIAWPGAATDGRRHVPAALAAGAAAVLVEAEGVAAFGFDDARIAALPGLKAACGPIAAQWFGRPADAMTVVAVTGTNGKSSTAWWTAQALAAQGTRCAVAGTLGIGEPPSAEAAAVDPQALGSITATGLTTPDPVTLHRALRNLADGGVRALAIEASSIGLAEHRMAGLPVAVAQFTNLTQDHLDYHGSMAAYRDAKRALFAWPGLQAAVLNLDDAEGAALAALLGTQQGAQRVAQQAAQPGAGDTPALWTVALQQPARLQWQGLHYQAGGLAGTLVETSDRAASPVPISTRLVGDYNASNLLGVLGALRALGVPLAEAAAVAPRLSPVPGRLQQVPAAAGQPLVLVDYAHTPDALDKALGALQPLASARGGALWCVFGCGGNRDAGKRPRMGAIAERLARHVVLTSDNPRHEDPQAILQQIAAGLQRPEAATVIVDRAEAIGQALCRAAETDVVLIAGKGHEDYQEVAGVKRPFLDAAVASAALHARRGA